MSARPPASPPAPPAVASPRRRPASAPLLLRLGLPCCLSMGLAGSAWAGGGVELRSEPAGAQIFLDGVDTGLRSPAILRDLPAGKHHIKLLGDCAVGEADLVVKEGQVRPLDLTLVSGGGTLRVVPTPASASVWVDGAKVQDIAEVPAFFACGMLRIYLTAPGYQPVNRWVTIQMGLNVELPVTLSPERASPPVPASEETPLPTAPSERPRRRPGRVAGLSVAAVGGVSLGIGSWQLVDAYRNYDDYAAIREDPKTNHEGDARYLREEVHRPRNIALTTLSLGGGLVLSGLVLSF